MTLGSPSLVEYPFSNIVAIHRDKFHHGWSITLIVAHHYLDQGKMFILREIFFFIEVYEQIELIFRLRFM